MKKKPLLITVEQGLVHGYRLPRGVDVLVVDLDTAKHEGQETKARRWLRKVSDGSCPETTSEELGWGEWERL
jgi:hypothetical protein